ncbi:hypothetical protein [Kineosporia babensis]|uniref:Uncharacterized protein n=1 Tax=Kineosporia babensis TaxID=499548 RepID=A0A9X1NBT9_9ACTN|nr:hypothetical protein [Kineosporia babensis]MCD5310891.1 hypothetical protein [Kineosporia babensis]
MITRKKAGDLTVNDIGQWIARDGLVLGRLKSYTVSVAVDARRVVLLECTSHGPVRAEPDGEAIWAEDAVWVADAILDPLMVADMTEAFLDAARTGEETGDAR